MRWHRSYRADKRALPLANAHYNRQNPDSAQFVPPGGCAVFLTEAADALWVTSTPQAEYVQHAWAGAWVNSLFRNESTHLASELIEEAVAAMVDSTKVKANRKPGRVYLRAGFRLVGKTKGGLLVFQMLPEEMPPPSAPLPYLPAGQLVLPV